MKYQLKGFNRNISESELLDDLKKIAGNLRLGRISSRQYDDNGGKYASGTIGVRFGNWNNALTKAGLKPVLKHNPSQEELFKNLEDVWMKLGRQPVSRDMKRPLSEFSTSTYITKFTSFRSALILFVENINTSDINKLNEQSENTSDCSFIKKWLCLSIKQNVFQAKD